MRTTSLTRALLVHLASLTLILGAGCIEESIAPIPTGEAPEAEGSETPNEGKEPQPTAEEPVYHIRVASPQPLAVPAGGRAELTFLVTADWIVAPDEQIDLELLAPGTGVRLEATRILTGLGGFATVVVEADWMAAMEALVVARHADAGEVVAELHIEVPPAALDVHVQYPSASHWPVDKVEISVHDATVGCDPLQDLALPAGLAGGETSDLDEPVRFDGLPGNVTTTVLAIAYAGDEPRATGCTTGAWLEGGEVNETIVVLEPLHLDPTGTYNADQSYDLGEIASGGLADPFWVLYDFADDPADYLVDAIESWMGVSFGFLRPSVVAFVEDYLVSIMPDSVGRFLQGVIDAGNLLRDLGVEATMTIWTEDGETSITERWNNVVFDWTGGCDPSNEPGCNERRVNLDSAGLDTVEAVYAVSVDEEGTLAAPTHELYLPIAGLYRVIITELLFPSLGDGATTTACVLDALLGCAGIAEALDESDGNKDGYVSVAGLDIPNDTVESACLDLLGILASIVDNEIDNLLDEERQLMTREGGAVVLDETGNRRPDRISDGEWTGVLWTSESTPSDITGGFEAVPAGQM